MIEGLTPQLCVQVVTVSRAGAPKQPAPSPRMVHIRIQGAMLREPLDIDCLMEWNLQQTKDHLNTVMQQVPPRALRNTVYLTMCADRSDSEGFGIACVCH